MKMGLLLSQNPKHTISAPVYFALQYTMLTA